MRLLKRRNSTAIVAATPVDQVVGFNSANRLLAMASATLAGEHLSCAKGHCDDAVRRLWKLWTRLQIQDALNYEEPPAWYFPVRETLGMELLAAGKTTDAEQVFRDDLKQYPENGWSLNGLAICSRPQRRGRGSERRCEIQESMGARRCDVAGVGAGSGDCSRAEGKGKSFY